MPNDTHIRVVISGLPAQRAVDAYRVLCGYKELEIVPFSLTADDHDGGAVVIDSARLSLVTLESNDSYLPRLLKHWPFAVIDFSSEAENTLRVAQYCCRSGFPIAGNISHPAIISAFVKLITRADGIGALISDVSEATKAASLLVRSYPEERTGIIYPRTDSD